MHWYEKLLSNQSLVWDGVATGIMTCIDRSPLFPLTHSIDNAHPHRHPFSLFFPKHSIDNAVVSRVPPKKWSTQDDYIQPRKLWEILSAEDKASTVKNIAGNLGSAKEFIQKRQIGVFNKVSPDLGKRVEDAIAHNKK